MMNRLCALRIADMILQRILFDGKKSYNSKPNYCTSTFVV